MANTSSIITNLTAGIFSPTMYGRIDYEKFYNSARELKNITLLPQGGGMKTAGRFYVKPVKDSTKNTRLEEFIFAADDAIIKEMGDEYMRFFKDHAAIDVSSADSWVTATSYEVGDYVDESGTIYYCAEDHTSGTFATDLAAGKWVEQSHYEIPTPYSHNDIFDLQLYQDSDLVYIVHNDYQIKKLSRYSDTDFRLEAISWVFPPMLDENTDESWTLNPSATTGSITIVASENTFDDGHVGYYFQIGEETGSPANMGLVQITAVTDAKNASATVINTLSTSSATYKWAECAFNDYRGHAEGVCIYQNRLCFGKNNRVYCSQPGIFNNFYIGDGTADDDAIIKPYAFGTFNTIRWLASGSIIYVGTDSGVINMSASGDSVMTAANAVFDLHDSQGCSKIQPIVVSNRLFFIHRDTQQVMSYDYLYDNDRFKADPTTIKCAEETSSGIVEMAYQQAPYNRIHCVLGDGKVFSLTHNSTENVEGWSVDCDSDYGDVKSIAVIPQSYYDELWTVTEYEIDGSTVKYIEYQDDPRSYNMEDHVYTHASGHYSGAATDSITGADHLEGETIQVRADGQVHPDVTVESGGFSLNSEYEDVYYGLGYTGRIRTHNYEIALESGVGFILLKKIVRAFVYFVRTFSAKMGTDIEKEQPIALTGDVTGDTAPEGRTGIEEVPFPGGVSRDDAFIEIEQEYPICMLVNDIIAEVSV